MEGESQLEVEAELNPKLIEHQGGSDNLTGIKEKKIKQREGWGIGAKATALATLLGALPVITLGVIFWQATEQAITEKSEREKNLPQTIVLATLVISSVAGGIGAFLANRATKQVTLSAAAVEKLGAGELDIRVPVKGSDELAILGDNINKIAAQLQTWQLTERGNVQSYIGPNNTIANLARNEALFQGDIAKASRAFTEAVANTIKVERVSIWQYNSDRTKLNCLDLYDSKINQHLPKGQGLRPSAGVQLQAVDFPEYFATLAQKKSIITYDAQTEAPTKELSSTYLTPSDIKSILAIPIQISGHTVGVIACEAVGKTRAWQAEEQTFVRAVANLIALALESEVLQGEVEQLLDVGFDLEQGNLTAKARVSEKVTGLIADTLNSLGEQLTQVIKQVLATALKVAEGTVNLEKIAQTVTKVTDKQAQSITQVLNQSELVEKSAIDSAIQVGATKQSLEDLSKVVEESTTALASLTQGTNVLQGGTDRIVQQMKTLGEFVGLADQFVQDQSEIAQQTLVLALNAGLVAARASEQKDPRKFEIVAREFEKIAEQVSNLAEQTNEGLNTLQQRTSQIHSVVSGIDTEVQNLGVLLGDFTQGVMVSNQVFDNVKKVTVEAIAGGEAVAKSTEEIVRASQATALAMREIAAAAGETAQLSQNTLSQSEHIEQLSNQLLKRIEFFQLPETQNIDVIKN
ncbi:MAG: GAF domain-containing protein [Gomphosphaeria aponina SAG 52.96 = DSM 107014]|uniref:GAF domain-containing protein n=1 Tax=Gomphosphaeria aponina SAG 52.96 = DSM 107014 TaxID=1521640 RepID=A0A941GZ27_9CHRO|nr:GAF domain-containing protein [Gomphosphaeria aponina SAG 52.96 = DSM 107014]